MSVSFLESGPTTILVTYSSSKLGGDTTRTLVEFCAPVDVPIGPSPAPRFVWEMD